MLRELSRLKNDKNAQLIFATTITIVFIVLVGITAVNMSSYTNYKHETTVDKNLDVVQQAETTEYAIEQAIMHTNHHESISGYGNKETQINDDIIDGIEPKLDDQLHRVGGRVDIDQGSISHERGTRIWRPRYGNLTRRTGSTNYDLTTSGNTRAFTITIREITSGNIQFGLDNYPDVTITDIGSGQMRISNADGDECTTDYGDSDPAQISFTQGTVDTITCEALPGKTDTGGVSISNTDNIEAGFNMVVDKSGYSGDVQPSDGSGSAKYDSFNTNWIQSHDAIYSTTVDIETATSKSTLATEMTVTPQTSLEAKQ